jgi:4-carboxymuconolactone decarboxylase
VTALATKPARLLVMILVAVAVTTLACQSARPADIHPESLSRLPPLTRSDLAAEDQRIWDYLAGVSGTMPKAGPPPVTIYSPKSAEPIQMLNQYLRQSIVGPRYFELSALVASREFDQQYEWSGHEPAAVRAGLEQPIIDVVKYNRDVSGVPDKDATVIRLGRALFREHKVSPDLWAKAVEHFGRQGAIEVTTIMADYAMVGFLLTAVDQQLPPDRQPLLPPR